MQYLPAVEIFQAMLCSNARTARLRQQIDFHGEPRGADCHATEAVYKQQSGDQISLRPDLYRRRYAGTTGDHADWV